MSSTTKFIARTAMLLALTVLFQSLRQIVPIPPSISIYIIGSLVNLSLILAGIFVGLKGGIIISVMAPIIAFMQGHIKSDMPFMVVAIALGNIAIVAAIHMLYNKNKYASIIIGAVLKFAVLYISIIHIVIPLLYPQVPDQLKAVLSVNYSWPQLITALIGGMLALIIEGILAKAIKSDNRFS